MRGRLAWIALVAIAVGCGKKDGDGSSNASSSKKTTKDAVPAKGARPPKPKALAMAKAPRLPKLKEQEASPPDDPGPKHNPIEEYPCGSVWTGDEEQDLECGEPADETKFVPPAVALIPYELLHADKDAIPKTVDHRVDGFEGKTLNQGKTPSCTAFALTSLINHGIGLWTGTPGDVSSMQIWARYHSANGWLAVAANLGKGFASSSEWPYDSKIASSWLSKKECKTADGCGQKVDEEKLAALEKKSLALFDEEQRIDMKVDGSFDVVEAWLAEGRDVGIGGKLPKSFKAVGEKGSKYVPDFTEYGKGAHAFVTVGYTHLDDGERYFLLKNSWGESWGDGGFAWIHEQTLKRIIGHAHVVVIDPIDDVGLRRHKRKKGTVAACAAHEAPDSVDGACKPICEDGSPQHAGYCGVGDDCTKGFVNVAGECVLAAPKAKGTEPKTKIAFDCAPGGCLYTLPKGVEGCTSEACQKSCPAPDFRLGKGKSGLVCLE